MNKSISVYHDPAALAESFAEKLFIILEKESGEKDKINICLSGGSTPKFLFKILAQKFKDRIRWNRVHFYWGDERCVPPDNEQSNYGMTKKCLLDCIDIPAENIHRIRGEENPYVESERYAHEISQHVPAVNMLPHFDLVMLGMGDDGHTLSIFPKKIDVFFSGNICEVAEHPVTGQKRITLTGGIINNSNKVVFLVTGKNKSDIIRTIIEKRENYNNYPAALIDPVSKDLEYLLDKESAKYLRF